LRAGCSHHGKASRKAIDLEPMEFGELLWHVKIPMGPRMEQSGARPTAVACNTPLAN